MVSKRKKAPPNPGSFVYGGAMVFEIDNNGKQRARKDIGPDYKGKFKNKFFKPPKKGG